MAGGEDLVMRKTCFLERMRKGVVADVVEQGRQADGQSFVAVDLAERGDGATRQVIGAERVLEAGVGSAGIDEERVTELAHVAQALDGRRVEDRQRLRFEADVVPERVANDLERQEAKRLRG